MESTVTENMVILKMFNSHYSMIAGKEITQITIHEGGIVCLPLA